MLVYVHGVDHPLIAAIHEGSHDVEDEEALSELMGAQILYLGAQKKVLEVQVKYTERGLMLMKDQPALDDDAPDFIKLWKSHE